MQGIMWEPHTLEVVDAAAFRAGWAYVAVAAALWMISRPCCFINGAGLMDELAQLWQWDAQHDLKAATSAIAQRQLPAVALRDIARNA